MNFHRGWEVNTAPWLEPPPPPVKMAQLMGPPKPTKEHPGVHWKAAVGWGGAGEGLSQGLEGYAATLVTWLALGLGSEVDLAVPSP